MAIGLLTLHVQFPGCNSLKAKRSRLKPFMVRLHREFNVSVAEMDHQDAWQDATVGCALVSNDAVHARQSLEQVGRWIEQYWPDVVLVEEQLELI